MQSMACRAPLYFPNRRFLYYCLRLHLSARYHHKSPVVRKSECRSEDGAVQIVEEAFEELRVGEVSAASGRGRRTTRNVSLLCLPGAVGRLADTPGFSQPGLAKVTSTSLSDLFPEVGRRIDESKNGRCGFPTCCHVGEPFCVVGEDWDRHSHYIALLEEVRNREKVEKRVFGKKWEAK